MPLLRADDDAARLRGVWLGPDPSIRWLWDWTFPEWWIGGTTAALTWIVLLVGGWMFWGTVGVSPLEQLIYTPLLAIPVGAAAGWQAKERLSPLVDSDRGLPYLVAGWCSGARILFYAHGPVDKAVAYGAGGVWLFLAPFTVVAPGPAWFWLAVSGFVCVQGARVVRDRVESPDRLRQRTWARLERAPGPVTWTLNTDIRVGVRPDSCIPRTPYAPRTRSRFMYDLARKAIS